MTSINQAILAMDNSLAVSIAAKATLILACALTGTLIARRNRAAVRHTLLAAAFGVLLLLPVVALVSPPLTFAVAAQEHVGPIMSVPAINIERSTATTAGSVVVATRVPQAPAIPLPTLLLSGWLCGLSLFLIPVIAGLWQARLLRRSGLPWRHGQSLVDELASKAGIYRRIEVLLHEGAPGPMTCGIVHPAVMLPPDAELWDAEDLNRALVHELEHVRRSDWIIHCLARMVCAVYWFHPLVWIAWNRLALDAERACDDAVLTQSEGTAYADQLVGLAQRLSSVRRSPALAMAGRADLSARVGSVLNSKQRRGRAGKFSVTLAWTAAVALVVTMSPLRIVAAPQVVASHVTPPVAIPAQAVVPPVVKPVVLAQAITPRPAPQSPTPQTPATLAIASPMQFGANVILVILDISVTDPSGKTVEGLHADDFALTEDGKPQKINIFEFQQFAASAGAQSAVSSYYVAGYYTSNGKMDSQYRKVNVAMKDGSNYKIDFRAGYYAEAPGRVGATPTADSAINYSLGPGMIGPSLRSKVDPEYSEEARRAKYSGTATLNVTVDETGSVVDVRVVRRLGMGLDEKAMEAVTRWKFAPGTKDGKPVTMSAEVTVNFRLL